MQWPQHELSRENVWRLFGEGGERGSIALQVAATGVAPAQIVPSTK